MLFSWNMIRTTTCRERCRSPRLVASRGGLRGLPLLLLLSTWAVSGTDSSEVPRKPRDVLDMCKSSSCEGLGNPHLASERSVRNVQYSESRKFQVDEIRPSPTFEAMAERMQASTKFTCPVDGMNFRQSADFALLGARAMQPGHDQRTDEPCFNPRMHDMQIVQKRVYLLNGEVIKDLKDLPTVVQRLKAAPWGEHVDSDVNKLIDNQKSIPGGIVIAWHLPNIAVANEHMAHWFQAATWAWSFMEWFAPIAAAHNLVGIFPDRPHRWGNDVTHKVSYGRHGETLPP